MTDNDPCANYSEHEENERGSDAAYYAFWEEALSQFPFVVLRGTRKIYRVVYWRHGEDPLFRLSPLDHEDHSFVDRRDVYDPVHDPFELLAFAAAMPADTEPDEECET